MAGKYLKLNNTYSFTILRQYGRHGKKARAKKLAKAPAKPVYQFQAIELNVGQIVGIHPMLENLAVITGNLEYLLDSVKVVAPDYFLQLLQLHPLILAKDAGRYYCVSNPRLFQMAKIILPDDQLLACRQLLDPTPESVIEVGQTDFYLSHLLFSLRPQDGDEQLCRFWTELDTNLMRGITPEIRHQTSLAKLLNTSRNLSYRRREPNGKNNDLGK